MLLRIFFAVARDPTQVNRQGPDVGTSSRFAIFYSSPEQQKLASASMVQLNAAHVFSKPIATELTPLRGFYKAEAYHQDYAPNNPDYPYIMVCDRPKIEALKKQFPISSLTISASSPVCSLLASGTRRKRAKVSAIFNRQQAT